MNGSVGNQWLLTLLVLAGLLLSGCNGCFGPERVAILEGRVGDVQRDFSASIEAWQSAKRGAEFQIGDGLRTAAEAHAELRLDDGSQLSLQPETTVRFLGKAPESAQVAFDVTTGVAVVDVGSTALMIETSLGLARIEPHSRVRLQPNEDGLRFFVQVGRAVFGKEDALDAGSAIQVSLSGKIEAVNPSENPANGGVEKPPVLNEPVEAKVQGVGVKLRKSMDPNSPWVVLAEGRSKLPPGSQIELGAKNTVVLERAGASAILQGAGRFQVAPQVGVLVASGKGEVLAGGTSVVRVAVPGGVIVVVPSGRSRILTIDTGTQVEVLFRTAMISHGDEREQIEAGQSASLTPLGEVQLQGVGLSRSDISVAVGESWVVHDPAPPTDIRFEYPELCESGGVLELLKGKRKVAYAAGPGNVALQVERGTFTYQLRCLIADGKRGRVVKRGKVSVLKDAGTRGLPAKAPVSELLADGREYTVLYQNRLPEIALTWKAAPASVPLQLRHQYRKKNEVLKNAHSTHRFKAGGLREGRHIFIFQGGGKLSRRTTVNIRFDNAAPTASLDVPALLSLEAGQSLTVAGIALPGSTVLVGGKSPTLDRQGRFRTSTVLPEDGRALAIVIRHSRRGNHVFLRRGKSL